MPVPDASAKDTEVLDALTAFAAAKQRDVIALALDAARDRLHMDAAYVSTITPEIQRVDQVAGDTSALGFTVGTTLPLEETYCSRMLTGELPQLVPDTAAEPCLANLAVTANIGAYVGIPIKLADGRLHGTLCCASGEPRNTFGPDELHFMEVLAGIVAGEIDRTEGNLAQATDRLRHHPTDPPSTA
jgi:GAF domain-containing protein